MPLVLSRTHGLDLARSSWLGLASLKKGRHKGGLSTLKLAALFIYIPPLPPSPRTQFL